MRLLMPACAALSLTLLTAAAPAIAAPAIVVPTPKTVRPTTAAFKRMKPLFDAAEQGDTAQVEALLNAGVLVNSQYPNGLTPLFSACMMNHPATVKLLLERGANPNAALNQGTYTRGATPLIAATNLLGCGLAGAKMPAAPKGYENHEVEFTKAHPEQVRRWEAQLEAWSKGYTVIARLLLDHGANVNAQAQVGTTAVDNAADSGDVDTVRLLLDRGARLDATNGYFALAGATTGGQQSCELVKILLAHGAKPNALSTNDLTPLGRASKNGDAETVRLLLAAGADVSAVDPFGDTALMLARRDSHTEIVALLQAAGAKDLPRITLPESTLLK